MTLDNLPIPCGCGKHSEAWSFSVRGIHPSGKLCPIQIEDFPGGLLSTCRPLRGSQVVRKLAALGAEGLAYEMLEDMSCEEALDFACRLRKTADHLESEHQGDAEKSERPYRTTGKKPMKKDCPWGTHTNLDESLAKIREAAQWYEKVSRLGYGVHACG